MKLRAVGIVLLTFLSVSTVAHAGSALECKAKQIYDTNMFEESFSIEEYPDVSVDLGEAWIGASRYSILDGDKIETLPSVGANKAYRITPGAKGDAVVYVSTNTYMSSGGIVRTGQVHVSEAGGPQQLIADLICEN